MPSMALNLSLCWLSLSWVSLPNRPIGPLSLFKVLLCWMSRRCWNSWNLFWKYFFFQSTNVQSTLCFFPKAWLTTKWGLWPQKLCPEIFPTSERIVRRKSYPGTILQNFFVLIKLILVKNILKNNQGILKGEVSLYHWLVWISLFWK